MYSTYNENMLTKTHKVIKKNSFTTEKQKVQIIRKHRLGHPFPTKKIKTDGLSV